MDGAFLPADGADGLRASVAYLAAVSAYSSLHLDELLFLVGEGALEIDGGVEIDRLRKADILTEPAAGAAVGRKGYLEASFIGVVLSLQGPRGADRLAGSAAGAGFRYPEGPERDVGGGNRRGISLFNR